MHILKKLLILIFILFSNFSFLFAEGEKEKIKEGLLNQNNTIIDGVTDTPTAGDLTIIDSIFVYFKDSISSLLLIVVIGVFLFMGIRLVIARGNPEELKKTMLQFVYVAIGIFVVSIAWAIVKLVSGLNI